MTPEDEEKLGRQMLMFERACYKLGLRDFLPADLWSGRPTPLTVMDLHRGALITVESVQRASLDACRWAFAVILRLTAPNTLRLVHTGDFLLLPTLLDLHHID